MEPLLNYIDNMSNRLEQALSEQDWETVKQLDNELRREMAVRGESPAAADTAPLMQSMRRLASTYSRVIQACEAHRQQIRQEIMGVQRGRRGVQAYQAF